MAMYCAYGRKNECDGCMMCQKPKTSGTLGQCSHCGESILKNEPRYEFSDGEIVHDDCVLEYIRDHYFHEGV